MALPRVIPCVIASLAAACGSSTSPQPPGDTGGTPVPAATVNATPSIAFTPSTVALAVGGTVTFAFGSVAHNVYFDDDPAGAPAAITGENVNTSLTRTFTSAGVYEYNCHIHPGMRGTVVVGGATGGGGGSGGYDRIASIRPPGESPD
jgi:plastocyanin